MNPYGILAAIGLAALVAWHLHSLQEQNAELREEKVLLEASLKSYAQKETQRALDKQAREFREKELETQLMEAELENEELRRIFSDHDFTALVAAKPGLITTRMRAATQRVWDSFEEISRRGAGAGPGGVQGDAETSSPGDAGSGTEGGGD